MKLRPTLFTTALILAVSLGCKKENDTTTCTEANLQTKVDAFTQAATAFSTNQSRANCLAYVNSLEALINTAANCPNSSFSKSDLDDARAELADARRECQ